MSNGIKVKIAAPNNIRASAVAIGSPKKLSELSDIDMNALEQGAMLVYDESLGIWKAKKTIEDGTIFEGGHY
jgi:hypothetical protein